MPKLSTTNYQGDKYQLQEELAKLIAQKMQGLGWICSTSLSESHTREFNQYTIYCRKGSILFRKRFHFYVEVNRVSGGYEDANGAILIDKPAKEFDNFFKEIAAYVENKEVERRMQNQVEINKELTTYKRMELSQYFIEKLKSNQAKIEPSLIPNLLKVQEYYQNQIMHCNKLYDKINADDFYASPHDVIKRTVLNFETAHSQVTGLESSMNLMIDAYLKFDLVSFYSVYNEFENMGLFTSRSEKAILKNLDAINNPY